MTTAVYLRVSTDDQARNQTIETQRAEIRRYCDLKKIASFQEFADDGVSGKIPFTRRRQSSRLLEMAKQGTIETLIIYRLDRLGRNARSTLNAVAELEKHGVKVRSITEEFDTATPTGRLMLTILSGFAAHEWETIRNRTMDGKDRKARKGGWLGGVAPYGYQMKGRGADGRLELFEEAIPGCEHWSRVAVIRRIYEMAAEGRSCYQIAADLTRLGIPPGGRSSAVWRPSQIRYFVKSRIYMGLQDWGKTNRTYDDNGVSKVSRVASEKWIESPCPAIVAAELWQRANAALPKNQIAAMAHAKNDYLLRGLIRCGACGLTFSGATTTRPSLKKALYYRCAGTYRGHVLYGEGRRCPSSGVRGEGLEAAVWTDIKGFLSRPGTVIHQLEEQMTADGGEARRIADEIRQLERALALNVDKRNRIVSLLTDGVITREDFKQQEKRIAENNAGTEGHLATLRERASHAESDAVALVAARSALEDLRGKMSGKLTFEQRRRAVEALVDCIIITPEEGKPPIIRVRYRFTPDARRATDQWRENRAFSVSARASTNPA